MTFFLYTNYRLLLTYYEYKIIKNPNKLSSKSDKTLNAKEISGIQKLNF